ncbi:MAG TPA: hypothetical protein VJP89_04245 [Pyrinomonadaceae bacterium]|nr:hypothetical protein [Pyrinomonadaceae bacterium]
MSFTKLKNRINDLPLILAGPMVRRVEPTSVSVWLALREPRDVRLQVFDPAGLTVDFQSDPTPTFAIGKFLHMVVVTARPPQPLPDGEVRSYTLSFEPQGGGVKQDLFDPGVVAATKTEAQDFLVYPSDPKGPTFKVPPASLDQMRIFHTSCRKIDGEGVDAFPAIDHAFDEALRHSQDRLRPTMLFLTGDQIYADGPVRGLLEILTDIGGTLLGEDEILPVVNQRPEDLPMIRTFVAVDQAGLKNPRQYPALSLGEFIALYLLTFSNVLWPPDHHDHDSFTRGLLSTRRIFANLATYMIFDDHELSDTWYLTRSWAMPLFKSELGRRVLQNALSAYALCQAWGNTPDQFAPPTTPGRVLLDALVAWRTQNYKAGSPAQQVIARVLAIPDASSFEATNFDLSDNRFHQPPTQILNWHYTVPCKALSINVFDIYTWKKFDAGNEYEPGDHLPQRALDAQVHKIGNQRIALYVASNVVIHRHPRTGGDPDTMMPFLKGVIGRAVGVVGVSAVAIFAAHLYDNVVFWLILGAIVGVALVGAVIVSKFTTGHFIPPLGWLNRALKQVHYDEIGTEFEWHSAPFERLLDRVARDSAQTVNNQQFARVLFLSGDVHHSFAMRLSYFADFNQGTPQLRASFAQLVSSPSKYVNESAQSYDDKAAGEFVGWKRASGNEKQEPKIKPGGGKVNWLGKGEFWVTKIKPGLPKFDEQDNHRYKIEPIRPRPEQLKFSTLPPKTQRTFDDMLSDLDLHQRAVLLQARHSDVVRANNVSDVTFTVAGDQTKVRQDVWWWYSGISDDPPGWFVRTFEVDMNPINPPTI